MTNTPTATKKVARMFVNVCRNSGKSLGILDLQAMTEAFNVSTRTIRRWVAAGQLPKPKRLGKYSYWQYEDIRGLMTGGDAR